MDSKAKKILILAIVIMVLTIGTILYFSFFKKDDPSTTSSGRTPSTGFSPFGTRNGTSTSPDRRATSTVIVGPNGEQILPKLRLISIDPVAGATASSTGSTTIIRYVERGRGHIYETRTDGSEIVKISNKTIPNIYEAFFMSGARDYLIKYIEDENDLTKISARLIKLKQEKIASSSDSSSEILYTPKISYIEDAIDSVIPSPDKKEKVFVYSTKTDSGITIYKNTFSTGKIEKIFSSPFKYWSIFWPEKNTLILTNKPSAYGQGYVYTYSIGSGGGMSSLYSGKALEILPSSDFTKIAFSEIKDSRYIVSIYDTKTKALTESPLQTTVSKCTWGTRDALTLYCAVPTEYPPGIYPEDWLKGLVSLNDKIWKYDVKDEYVELLGNPLELAGISIDVIKMFLDPKEQYLIFQNKNDLSLWSLEIK